MPGWAARWRGRHHAVGARAFHRSTAHLLVPAPHQLVALVRWQFLEMLERRVQLLTLGGGQLLEAAAVLARFFLLLGCHLLPAIDALADLATLAGRQRLPLLGTLEHARLALRRK